MSLCVAVNYRQAAKNGEFPTNNMYLTFNSRDQRISVSKIQDSRDLLSYASKNTCTIKKIKLEFTILNVKIKYSLV